MRRKMLGIALIVGYGIQVISNVTLPQTARAAGLPAETSVMVCGREGQNAIAKSLRLKTVRPVRATWANQVYSCRYQYADGSIGVSVKEFGGEDATVKYFDSLAKKHGERAPFSGLGDAGFVTRNGSVVVRKDFNVLFVDVQKVPKIFGVPPRDRVVAAQTVAGALMECWVHG